MYRYRKAFGYLVRTLSLIVLFYLLMEYGLDFIDQLFLLQLDPRWKAFGFLIGLNLILALSLPAFMNEFKRIRAESQFKPE